MRVLVTGGAGFIGANLTEHLLDLGMEVSILDDFSTGVRGNLSGLDTRLIEGSVLNEADLESAFQGADAVVHLAARPSVPRSIADPLASHQVNATGTLMVLEAARRFGNLHTVVASSSSVYGANPAMPKREDLRPIPLSPYAVSKLATETYALAFQHCYGLPTLAFRFFNVFGPLQSAGHAYAAVVPAFLDAALRGEAIPLFGDGEQTRDFTYVGTVTEVISTALKEGTTDPEPINLAFGSRRSLNDVLLRMGALLDVPLEVETLEPRPGDVRHSTGDATRLLAYFPEVEPVDFDTGLRQTIAWFQSGRQTEST